MKFWTHKNKQQIPKKSSGQVGGSILRKLFLSCMGFGLFMGAVFPFFALLFVVPIEGMFVYFSIACLFAGASIGLVNYTLVKLVLVKRLAQLSGVATEIGAKDLTKDCTIQSNDVIGEIANSVNLMRQNLREVIGEISGTSSEVSAAVHEITSGMMKNSERMLEQRNQTDAVATAMTEMAATVQTVAQHAANAAKAANDADEASNDGQQVVSSSIGVINGLATEVESTSTVIGDLAKDSEQIGTVLSVIKGIAEQTNLLALNAAIEAARAGEQGRGFAVVADEVRTLASRTAESTKEIEDMITRVQQGTGNAVAAMEAARIKAQESVTQIENVSASLNSITASVANITEMNTQISHAAGEQSSVAEEINKNVNRISEMANSTTDGVAQNMKRGEVLVSLTSRVEKLVSGFRLS